MSGRPKNSKNKPKAKGITLADLNKMFKETTIIPVDFSLLFSKLESVNLVEVQKMQEKEEKIDVLIHN